MTLRQQFSLLTSVLVLVLLAGNLGVTLMHAHDQFQRQLNARAYDAATALALSMSQVDDNDPLERSRLIDALFDRGFFEEIRFVSIDGQDLHRREVQAYDEPAAPEWFKRWLPFDMMTAEADVTNGWQRLGSVMVNSHTDFAYRNLWRMAQAEFYWFLVVLIISLILLEILLRWLFRPIQRVEEQALAICDKQWRIQEDIPRARELRQMVLAMNRMVAKLHAMFMEQAATTEHLRQETYHDPISGLLNRRGFNQRFEHLLTSDEEHSGVLMLMQLANFADYNQREGRQAGDTVIHQVGEALTAWHREYLQSLCGRHAGADFVLFVHCSDRHHAEELVTEFAGHLAATVLSARSGINFHVGAVFIQGLKDDPGSVFSRADAALRQAQSQGHGRALLYRDDSVKTEWTASQWHQLLRQTLNDGLIVLQYMPVVRTAGRTRELMQVEVFSRIEWQGEQLSAARFWPMVEQHGLAAAFDLAVVTQVLKELQTTVLPDGVRLCINISPASLVDNRFALELLQLLDRHQDLASQLIVEVPEFCIRDTEPELQYLGEQLKRLGVQLGVDQVGTGAVAFSYMKRLPLAQLRVDGSLNRGIHDALDQRFFVQSMIQIGHKLELEVLADGVEQADDIETLRRCAVNGISGFYYSRPLPSITAVLEWSLSG